MSISPGRQIGPVRGKVSADGAAGGHTPHPEGTNAVQRALAILLERYRLAVADLLHRDQRHLLAAFETPRHTVGSSRMTRMSRILARQSKILPTIRLFADAA